MPSTGASRSQIRVHTPFGKELALALRDGLAGKAEAEGNPDGEVDQGREGLGEPWGEGDGVAGGDGEGCPQALGLTSATAYAQPQGS